jgi:phosphopantetheine adenylyltransferase
MKINEVSEIINHLCNLHKELYSESYAIGYLIACHACCIAIPLKTKFDEINMIKTRIEEVEKLLKERQNKLAITT